MSPGTGEEYADCAPLSAGVVQGSSSEPLQNYATGTLLTLFHVLKLYSSGQGVDFLNEGHTLLGHPGWDSNLGLSDFEISALSPNIYPAYLE